MTIIMTVTAAFIKGIFTLQLIASITVAVTLSQPVIITMTVTLLLAAILRMAVTVTVRHHHNNGHHHVIYLALSIKSDQYSQQEICMQI